jgi:hypothetical protein
MISSALVPGQGNPFLPSSDQSANLAGMSPTDTTTQRPELKSVYFVLGGALSLAAVPPRVFVAVSPDLILATTVLIAIALPLLALIVSGDFGVKGLPQDAIGRIGERFISLRKHLLRRL